MPTFIIEHLEPKLWKWCLIEYKHISKIIGKQNLWFTNIKKDSKELQKYGKVIKQSVNELQINNACILDPEAEKTLMPKEAKKISFFIFGGILGNYPPKKRTKEELTIKLSNLDVSEIIPPNEIGGLETPPKNRSGMISEHVKNHSIKDGASKICHPRKRVVFNARNIGKKQMSTDNAVYVVHEICKGTPLEKMKFRNNIEISTAKNESVILPYRYVLVNKKPLISKELVKHLKKRGTF